MGQYHFTNAIGGFFEMPSQHAKALLPKGMEPVEPHPGVSLLSLMVFDFHSSEVGPYCETVLSILVPPRLRANQKFPKAGLYPFQVATSTAVSREHGIECYRLPHFPEDISVKWHPGDKTLGAEILSGGEVAIQLTISDHQRTPVSDLYHVFIEDSTGRYLSDGTFEGNLCDHEEELGSIRLFDTPFTRCLPIADVSTTPFREQWMTDGTETLAPLVKLG